MDRSYTQQEFLHLVDKIRRLTPNITLTTDVIVGFCTETDQDFEDTLDVMKRVRFDSAFTFKYSQRKNTIASRTLKDDITDEIKTKRIVKLVDLQAQIAYDRNKAQIGTHEEALIEKDRTSKSDEHCLARTDGGKLVIIPSEGLSLGQTVTVQITDATPHNLKGSILPSKIPA